MEKMSYRKGSVEGCFYGKFQSKVCSDFASTCLREHDISTINKVCLCLFNVAMGNHNVYLGNHHESPEGTV